MRFDEVLFESSIKNYSETFKDILRKSYHQAYAECKKWEEEIKVNPNALHPIEKELGKRIKVFRDFK